MNKDEKWCSIEKEDVIEELDTDPEEGLSEEEASKRLEKYGPNKLRDEKKLKPLQIFLRQFKNLFVMILIFATILSFLVGNFIDAYVILAVLIMNSILGFSQEYKAEKAMKSLKEMSSPKAVVIRDGTEKKIPTKEVVPGDIILVREGKVIPGDARILESNNLKVNEAPLTGESIPSTKKSCVLDPETSVSNQKNMIYMNTTATFGEAKAVVTETGMDTEIGSIANSVTEVKEADTPLQSKINSLAKNLTIFVVVFTSIIFVLSLMKGDPLLEILLVSISLAVSAVPQGLPAIITLTLATKMKEMASENAIVRKMLAVETLGSTDVICSDKTGTITKNEMTIREVYCNDKSFKVTGTGFEPKGKFLDKETDEEISPRENETFNLLLKTGLLCNNAHVTGIHSKDSGTRVVGNPEVIGDPTEGALVVAARKAGYEDLRETEDEITEISFDSDRKRMSVIYEIEGERLAYVKGAPGSILDVCSKILIDGETKKLTKSKKEEIKRKNEEMAQKPLRVLALAYRSVEDKDSYSVEDVEDDLIFLGLVGMVDAPREGIKESVEGARKAGIKTVMITGDYETTAKAIAEQVGIYEEGDKVISGREIDEMGDEELSEKVEDASVFSRVSPDHKMRILSAFQDKGHVVGMTGDGVNDAPAVKKAHIGISMGIKGTDVTKESSDMILEDDDYSTIVDAVETGRTIYDNIKKSVRLFLSANFAELVFISLVSLLGIFFAIDLPIPFLAIQVLWINLVTDGLPALALAVDPPADDIMERRPYKREKNFLRKMFPYIFTSTLIAVVVELMLLYRYFTLGYPTELIRTVVVTYIVVFEMTFVFNCRKEREIGIKHPFENKLLVGAVILTFALQLAFVYTPPFQAAFQTVALGWEHWITILLGVIPVLFLSPKYLEL